MWVPDDQGDGDPSTNDIAKGETLSGHFVTIPHADRYTGLQLNERAEALGSFNFVRIEDAATDPGNPGVVYFSDTGANKSETKHGRLYRMTFDPANPRNATLEVVLDGDAGDDIVNPDNLGIDPHVLLIQEDRNDTSSGYNRVLMYDLTTRVLSPIARLDPPPRGDRARRRPGGVGVERRGRRRRVLRCGGVAAERAGAPHEHPATGHRPRDRLGEGAARAADPPADPGQLRSARTRDRQSGRA